MTTTAAQTELKPLETRTLIVGFILVGIAVAVTTVSYLLNMTFVYQWLVWIIGIAFAGVALLSLEWTRTLRNPTIDTPTGWLRNTLLVSIPLEYVLGSQVCGLARHLGGLLTDLQHGAVSRDTIFGSSFERCPDEGQHSYFRCAGRNDRLHGSWQPAVQLPMVWMCINHLILNET